MSEEQSVEKVAEERATAVAEEAVEDVTAAEDTQTTPAGPPGPEAQGLTLDDLKVGYVVGLADDGNFVFDVFGKEKDLLSLLGLHAHADRRVNQIYNQTQMAGDTLVHEVGKALTVLNQKLDAALSVLAPKKPDNSI